jgi:uncharacterized protein
LREIRIEMTRILSIADTHGFLDAARTVIRERGPWDHIVHLGDAVMDAVDLAAELNVDVAAVFGNNEYTPATGHRDALVFEAGGARFYAVHGHQLDLNPWGHGLDQKLAELARRAAAAGAAVALFGHTHVPLVTTVAGVLLINPGAMSAGDQKKTYAAITVAGGKITAIIEEAGQ